MIRVSHLGNFLFFVLIFQRSSKKSMIKLNSRTNFKQIWWIIRRSMETLFNRATSESIEKIICMVLFIYLIIDFTITNIINFRTQSLRFWKTTICGNCCRCVTSFLRWSSFWWLCCISIHFEHGYEVFLANWTNMSDVDHPIIMPQIMCTITRRAIRHSRE